MSDRPLMAPNRMLGTFVSPRQFLFADEAPQQRGRVDQPVAIVSVPRVRVDLRRVPCAQLCVHGVAQYDLHDVEGFVDGSGQPDVPPVQLNRVLAIAVCGGQVGRKASGREVRFQDSVKRGILPIDC